MKKKTIKMILANKLNNPNQKKMKKILSRKLKKTKSFIL